jgi:CelD/BcsL family acetyltransferase involved in cellulose biosynthesis
MSHATMPAESPIAAFDFASGPLRGTQLALHGTRLLHQGPGWMESLPLHSIAAVSVGYERHEQRVGWGVVLLIVAAALFSVAGPLASLATNVSAGVTGAQSMAEILRGALRALEAFADLLPVAGFACLAAGVAMIVLGWIGTTTLVLMLPAAERAFPVRGQNRMLVDFAELLAERVAQRPH